jgi:ankyrin repeat protein
MTTFGLSRGVKVPRIVPASARIFRHALLGEVDTMRGLFEVGLASPLDVDAETGITPLHSAVSAANRSAIKYLLHRGADRDAKDFQGFSPIQLAWERLLTNSVTSTQRQVLEDICDEETLDTFEFTNLHQSVVKISFHSVEDELKNLMSSTATINDEDALGRTPLSWAAQRGDDKAVRLLLEYGADPNKAPPRTKTPLHYSAGYVASSRCTSLLLRYGADVHAETESRLTPLMWATINVGLDYANLEVLLNCTDTERVDINGRTALFHAASASVIPTRMLLEKGCNVNHIDDLGLTALHLGISYNRDGVVQTLLGHGADPYFYNPKTQRGILHHTSHYATLETVNALSTCQLRGIDVDARDCDGRTALDLLETRTPEPSPEFFEAFRRLLIDIEVRTTALTALQLKVMGMDAADTDDTATTEWETASEGTKSEIASRN